MTNRLWLPQATAAPNPSEVAAYLLQQNWIFRRANPSWAVYSKKADGEELELEVPQQAAAPDYGRAVALLLEDLARLEQRVAASILRDVRSSSMDIVRLAIEGSSTRDGRIPVEAGRRVYEAARDLLLAAACSVIDPRPVFAQRKPDEAMSLLGRARFGQTEVGSFVLTMECAVTPRLQQTLLIDPVSDAEEVQEEVEAPFERRTCLRLARALQAAEGATRESAASGRLEPFRQRAKDGVSANLCEAIAEILEATSAEALQAGFSFAAARPVRGQAPRLVAFSSDTATILRAGATGLRAEARYPEIELMGTVVKLDSSDPKVGGDAVLRTDLEGKIRQVKVKLDAAAYQVAIAAHSDRSLVRCTGDLAREGRSWVLRNARDFVVPLDPDES